MHLDDRLASLWQEGAVRAERLWDAYSRYLYLHRLKNIDALFHGIAAGSSGTVWATDGFVVAEAVDPRSPDRFLGLVTAGVAFGVRGSTLVVRPELAVAQREAERQAAEREKADPGTDPVGPPPDRVDPVAPDPVSAVKRRFYGVIDVDPNRLSRDAGRIAQEVVAHLAGLVGTDLQITIDIRASRSHGDGFPDAVMKIVEENASALHFKDHGFEAT